LTIPEYVSADATSLLIGLLERDPSKRIGSRLGMQEAKEHPFFRGLDWTRLQAKKIVPPINPMLQRNAAAGSHESKLARMPVDSSAGSASNQNGGDDMFVGFTFEAPSRLVQVHS
jgi:hypothetical protein